MRRRLIAIDEDRNPLVGHIAARRLARATPGGMLCQSEMEPGIYDADEDLAVLKETLRLLLGRDAR